MDRRRRRAEAKCGGSAEIQLAEVSKRISGSGGVYAEQTPKEGGA